MISRDRAWGRQVDMNCLRTAREIRALGMPPAEDRNGVVVLRFVKGVAPGGALSECAFAWVVETIGRRIVRHDGVEVCLLAGDCGGIYGPPASAESVQLVEISRC